MTDKVENDGRVNFKDILLQRDQDRKAKLKSLKEEKELSDPDEAKLFNDSFDNYCETINEKLKLVEEKKIEKEHLTNYLNNVSRDVQVLNRHLSVSTKFLKNFDVRKCLKAIKEIETKIKDFEAELLPKKKFAFKAQNKKTVEKISDKKDEVDAGVNKKVIQFSTVYCGFVDKKDETLKLTSEEIFKKDIELRNLQNCNVFICGNPSTVHISNLNKCKILSGPVSTSVLMDGCQDCDLVVACQQLRIHSTKQSRFYIQVTCKAIIEDSSDVQFAPYNFKYENIEKHYKTSGLDKSINKWNQVDDFNWLVNGVPSPNWREINEEERNQDWPV